LREKGIQVQFEAFFPHDIIMKKSSKAQEVAEGSHGPCGKRKKRLFRPVEPLGGNVEAGKILHSEGVERPALGQVQLG
jgi:hypothetical protein